MITRQLAMGDRDAAVSLWENIGLTRPWNDARTDFERAVAGPASMVLGGFVEDELIATAMVGPDGHRGWVYYLGVAPHHQKSGNARLLMAQCENWLRARSIPKLNLMIRTSNEAATGFYDALGYEIDSVVVRSTRLE